ncbi:MAG: RNA-binding S4 domain-containing protein [Verrucomicrobiae bacterium]|nr:RNA-binding S4 domain-containing protein [Verrucomicrobiae bacterium]
MEDRSENESMRLDKWLWCMRAYRTRSKASNACKAGHVHLNGQTVKPASPVRVGDTVEVSYPRIVRTFKVVGLLPRRVGYKVAVEYYEDLTPETEYDKLKDTSLAQSLMERDRGTGRPTKKQRRELEKWLEDIWEVSDLE